jgi:hypothetical protein
MVLPLFVLAVGSAIFYFTTEKTASFQLIDVMIMIGLVAVLIPRIFITSLLFAPVFASMYLCLRWLQHRHDT